MTALTCPWPVPHDRPEIVPGGADVWCLPLDLAESRIAELAGLLSPDERARAARYHFDRHRRRFIACRAQVRTILADYLHASAAELRFESGPRGKPALAPPWSGSGIRFNVSNSHEIALCAVALDRELGVDVEYVRTPNDYEGLAAQFFAQAEVDALRSLPESVRLQAFFNCWTRKEAVLKAVGTGLAFPLDRVTVTLIPGEPARLVAWDDTPARPGEWWLTGVDPAAGYVAALAAPGMPLAVQRWLSVPLEFRL